MQLFGETRPLRAASLTAESHAGVAGQRQGQRPARRFGRILLGMAGWLYVYKSAPGLSIILSLAWIVGGLIAFLGWARLNDSWPFAPVRVEEAYLELQDSTGDPDVAQAPV